MYKHIKELKKYKDKLTKQQFKTLKGQILAGDEAGAMKGLNKIMKKREALNNE